MTAPDAADDADHGTVERHASWAELFFDLVAAAGVATLAHVLRIAPNAEGLGIYLLLYLTFWLTWTTFMLYSNAAAGQTQVRRLMAGMFGLGVMAAFVPGVAHTLVGDGHDLRPLRVYAIAYVATRIYGSLSWRGGDVVLDFPVVQYSVGLLPWIASIWTDEPWKIELWTVGVSLDLLVVLFASGSRLVEHAQAKTSAQGNPRPRKGLGDGHSGHAGPTIHGVPIDQSHLSERLGLFVIIVLGESVVQVVNAAAQARYDASLLITGLGSFVLLAGMFGLSVDLGYAGLPHLRAGRIATRAALALHCLVTAVIAALGVALSSVVEHGSDPLPEHGRWLLCAAVAAYFALGVVTGIASHSSDLPKTTSRVATGIALPLALGLLAAGASGSIVVVALAVIVLAHLWFDRRQPPAQGHD